MGHLVKVLLFICFLVPTSIYAAKGGGDSFPSIAIPISSQYIKSSDILSIGPDKYLILAAKPNQDMSFNKSVNVIISDSESTILQAGTLLLTHNDRLLEGNIMDEYGNFQNIKLYIVPMNSETNPNLKKVVVKVTDAEINVFARSMVTSTTEIYSKIISY